MGKTRWSRPHERKRVDEKMRVLVVEDEVKVAGFVRRGLEEASYTVALATNAEEALSSALTNDYAVIILDIMLPGRSGLSVVRELRANGNNVPILAVTARGEPAHRVEGLDSGCDDYLPKPFAFDELLARLRALVRRHGTAVRAPRIEYAGLSIDPVTRVVARNGRPIVLTFKEFALLELLLRHPGHVFTTSAIMESVWGDNLEVGRNVLDVYMHFLRKKVDKADHGDARLLHTVRGVGYVLRIDQT